jgi:hypothetical protein
MYPRRTSIVKKARIKKARIRFKLFLEVKETLLQNREEGKTQKGRTKTKNISHKSQEISILMIKAKQG